MTADPSFNTEPTQKAKRLAWLGVLPILAGMLWLMQSFEMGALAFILLLPVTGGLLATGAAHFLWPGDLRIHQSMALCGSLGVIISIPLYFYFGLFEGAWLTASAFVSILCAGACAVDEEPLYPGVPHPDLTPPLAAIVAVDEVVLGFEQFAIQIPQGQKAEDLVGEVFEGLEFFEDHGWLDEPLGYHEIPPPLPLPTLTPRRAANMAYEHLSFESLYEPRPEEPGRARWQSFVANRTGHAYVIRHPEEQRPWIICCNGYRSGNPNLDLRLFRRYHQELGLNVLIPVLPLHGPRRIGRLSGEGFLSSQIMDSVHAEAQAIWDMRRLTDWIRSQGPPSVGALGLSLGGYTTALFASIEPTLACAIAGIPVADFGRLFWRHGPRRGIARLENLSLNEALVSRLLQPVSPLKLDPLVPARNRMIFGGTVDRLVSPDQVQDLAAHWGHPRTVWYEGGHMTFGLDDRVQAGIDATLRDAQVRA
ncbi:MAG: hypothetical protein CL917_13750 [Deltaproteobacteria bacterium]|nr:hypothetical protein [Deltaproteobacteria bacterium]